MANGLISAQQYGGPAGEIVEDPNATPLPQTDTSAPVVDDETPQPYRGTPYVPTSADVAPADRNIAEEQNWMKDLTDYANSHYDNENEREKFIERASKYTRNNIAMTRAANNQILLNDHETLDKVLFNQDKFQGRGPRNDYEASQVNPSWPAMRELALQHDPGVQKRIDGAFAHNSKMDVPETTERTDRFNQAEGLIQQALAGKPGIDKYEVLKQVDPAQLDLSKRQVNIMRHDLSALKSQKDIDNQMSHYMTVASGLLNEAHIYSNNDKALNQFHGALSSELKTFQRNRKDPSAPIDDNDVLAITSRLIRDRATGFQSWFGGPDRAFQVPDGWFTDQNRDDFVKRYGREPIDEDIYNLYQLDKANRAR